MASFVINDAMGRIVRQLMQPVSKGLNNIRIYGLDALPSGFCVLQVRCGNELICRKANSVRRIAKNGDYR
ncbi:MAG: hypothetical protein C5B59_11155 [Bacteroidetes bacterium]|nr:MAG: hypothetical protein C5B59_11155 [Bacteroidota bacterium]